MLLGFSSLVLASSSPPLTLPKGLLENLMILETLDNKRYNDFMLFTQSKSGLRVKKINAEKKNAK